MLVSALLWLWPLMKPFVEQGVPIVGDLGLALLKKLRVKVSDDEARLRAIDDAIASGDRRRQSELLVRLYEDAKRARAARAAAQKQ